MSSQFNSSPWYSVHDWCPSDYSLDSDRRPRDHVQYQYDKIDDRYYSLPYIEDMYRLLFDNNNGDSSVAYNLFHFTDSHPLNVSQYLGLYIKPVQPKSNLLDELAYVAFIQRFGIGNRKVGDLIFIHLLGNGVLVEDIMDSLRDGPCPYIDDGDFPHFERSLKALARKAKRGQLV